MKCVTNSRVPDEDHGGPSSVGGLLDTLGSGADNVLGLG